MNFKKVISYSIIFATLVAVVMYCTNIKTLHDIVEEDLDIVDVHRIEVRVFYSIDKIEEYAISKRGDINSFKEMLKGIDVRKNLVAELTGRPAFKETYMIRLHDVNNRFIGAIDIVDRKNVGFGRASYSIVNEPNLELIYKLIENVDEGRDK